MARPSAVSIERVKEVIDMIKAAKEDATLSLANQKDLLILTHVKKYGVAQAAALLSISLPTIYKVLRRYDA